MEERREMGDMVAEKRVRGRGRASGGKFTIRSLGVEFQRRSGRRRQLKEGRDASERDDRFLLSFRNFSRPCSQRQLSTSNLYFHLQKV